MQPPNRDGVLRVPVTDALPVTFTGTIIEGPGCNFIDNGKERFIIDGDLPHGAEMTVRGILTGSRIRPDHAEPVSARGEDILTRIRVFKETLPQ